MKNILLSIDACAGFLKQRGIVDVPVAVVLGTGLGSMIEQVAVVDRISYQEIPHFPVSTVEFHKGYLILAQLQSTRVLIMQGRFHFYEGYTMQEVTFPIRVLAKLGCRTLLLSNAAGGLNTAFRKGDLVLIDDHISMQPDNPLRGLNAPEFGVRFPDMSSPYDGQINHLILESAASMQLSMKRGVYVAVAGPNLETRAEYRFLRMMGADMVGMSTVPEVIVANQVGIRCAAVSVITDECDPDNLQPVNIEEIIEVAGAADKKLSRILLKVIENLDS